jgi:hypothetical protein
MMRYAIPVLVGLGFFCIISVVTLASTLLNSPPDPLAPYTSLSPGTPVGSLSDYRCQGFFASRQLKEPHFTCQIFPEDSAVLSVTINGDYEEIGSLRFQLQGVELASLVERWGRPTSIEHYGETYFLWWGKAFYAVVYARGLLTYHARVSYISVYAPLT